MTPLKNDGGSAKNIVRDMERAKEKAGENDMAALLDEMGIVYVRQHPYAKGRRLKADFAFIDTGETYLIEIVGGVYSFHRTRKDGTEVIQAGAHGSVGGVLADIDRLNEATINGFKMLRFTPGQVKDGYARETLKRLLTITVEELSR